MTKIHQAPLGRKPKRCKTYSCLRHRSDCPDWTPAVHYNIRSFLLCVSNQLLTFNVAIKSNSTRWSYISEDVCMDFLSLSNAIKYMVSKRQSCTCRLCTKVHHQPPKNLLTGHVHEAGSAACPFTSSSTVMCTDSDHR